MYSGYVNITQEDWLFYWFFEADQTSNDYDNPQDIPLIIWTNGGPGCTAMEGATTENGPLVLYRIKESYELATGQVYPSPYYLVYIYMYKSMQISHPMSHHHTHNN